MKIKLQINQKTIPLQKKKKKIKIMNILIIRESQKVLKKLTII